MSKFSFDHFPSEEEIIADATHALRQQIASGCGPEIAEAIISRAKSIEANDYTQEEYDEFVATDAEGIRCLARLQDPNVSLSDLSEEEREMISFLWVNYMCDQPYGQIINSMYRFLDQKIDYKRHAMGVIENFKNEFKDAEKMDGTLYNGTIIYLWTMINVVRNIRKAIQVFPLPMFNGMSLN